MSNTIKVIFIIEGNQEKIVETPVGLSILEVAKQNNVNLEGTCGGSMSCATCHVVIEEEFFYKLLPPSKDEEDVLDLAFRLTNTSRLGCQIIITRELDGIKIKLPVI
jgi:ferredoxin